MFFDGRRHDDRRDDRLHRSSCVGVDDDFFASGGAEGRPPASWFNAQFYAHRYPDLAAYAGAPALLFAHYNLFGVWEGRAANVALQSFDGTRYLADNPDVAQYVQANLADFRGSTDNGAIAHFVIYGEHEGRSAFTKDTVYLAGLLDVQAFLSAVVREGLPREAFTSSLVMPRAT